MEGHLFDLDNFHIPDANSQIRARGFLCIKSWFWTKNGRFFNGGQQESPNHNSMDTKPKLWPNSIPLYAHKWTLIQNTYKLLHKTICHIEKKPRKLKTVFSVLGQTKDFCGSRYIAGSLQNALQSKPSSKAQETAQNRFTV